MSDKCRKAMGELTLCANAKIAESAGFVEVQTMRNHETNQRRERLAIRKGKKSAPLHFCPWCKANIQTEPA